LEIQVLNNFFNILETVYSSFLDINWVKTEYGYSLTRKDLDGVDGNYAVVLNDNDKSILSKIKETHKDVYLQSKSPASTNQLCFYIREYTKVKLPIPESINVQSFSFNSRARGIHKTFEKLDLLPMTDYLNIPENLHKIFERLPRGLLHTIPKSHFWVVEDSSENVISMAITVFTEINKSKNLFIFYLVTQENLRNRGFAQFLVETILSKSKKGTKTIILAEKSDAIDKIVKNLNFQHSMRFEIL
jgi:hypothetical protein